MKPTVLVFDDSLSFGRQVRLLRVGRGLRQFDLAIACRLTPQAISLIERDIPVPRSYMERVSAYLALEVPE